MKNNIDHNVLKALIENYSFDDVKFIVNNSLNIELQSAQFFITFKKSIYLFSWLKEFHNSKIELKHAWMHNDVYIQNNVEIHSKSIECVVNYLYSTIK